MGTNKLLLPFGPLTVIEQVVNVILTSQVGDVVVVTGHQQDRIASALRPYAVRFAHNADYARGEMLSSIQTGLRAMRADCKAALITPGDQPLIETRSVEQVISAWTPGSIVIPSFQRRGGHPILIDRVHWPDILAAPPSLTLRDIIRSKPSVHYVNVASAGVICDMDTPDQYHAVLKSFEEHS